MVKLKQILKHFFQSINKMKILFIILLFCTGLSAQCDSSVIETRTDGMYLIVKPYDGGITHWFTLGLPFAYRGDFIPTDKLIVGRKYHATTYFPRSGECLSYSNALTWGGGVEAKPTVATSLPRCEYRSKIKKLDEVYILSSWVDCGADIWPEYQWQRVYYRKWRNLPNQNREDILISDLKPNVWYRLRTRCGDECDVISNYIRG